MLLRFGGGTTEQSVVTTARHVTELNRGATDHIMVMATTAAPTFSM